MRTTPLLVLPALVLALAAGCGGDDDDSSGDGRLTVYSGREEEIVEPLFERFEERTGVDVRVRYGDSAELAATIAEEGDRTPAELFFAQDPGSIGAVAEEGRLAELPDELLERVPERFRDPERQWVGTSGRVRVVAYNSDSLGHDELPESVFELTDPRWKGRIGFPPTNASFQAFVTAMRLTAGEDRTREWLEGIERNDPKLYEENSQAVEAVGRGEIDAALVNHYYVFIAKEEDPDTPVENHYLRGNDPGALVSTAAVGILESADDRDAAEQFVEYLLSREGQRFYAEEAEEAEYPLIEGVAPKRGLPALERLRGPDIELDRLGAELDRTLQLLNEVGFTT